MGSHLRRCVLCVACLACALEPAGASAGAIARAMAALRNQSLPSARRGGPLSAGPGPALLSNCSTSAGPGPVLRMPRLPSRPRRTDRVDVVLDEYCLSDCLWV